MLNEKTLAEIRTILNTPLEPELYGEMADSCNLKKYSAGDIIMDTDKYIRFIPLVLNGSIKVVRNSEEDNELFLYFLNAGETCPTSFICCMMDKKSSIRTVAEDDVVLISIPLQKLEHWMHTYRTWRYFIFQSFENRMNIFLETIDNIAFKKMDQRLLNYLKQKADTTQSKIIHVTHLQIAKDLNASREAVSRLLKKLEADKLVELGRNKITLV